MGKLKQYVGVYVAMPGEHRKKSVKSFLQQANFNSIIQTFRRLRLRQ